MVIFDYSVTFFIYDVHYFSERNASMINSNSPIPLHFQLRKIIEKKIQLGLFKEKIPSERELMEEYDVSRSTVREAISQLVIDGIVEKIAWKRYFYLQKAYSLIGTEIL